MTRPYRHEAPDARRHGPLTIREMWREADAWSRRCGGAGYQPPLPRAAHLGMFCGLPAAEGARFDWLDITPTQRANSVARVRSAIERARRYRESGALPVLP